jgi:2-polyprenyl-6-methoxyphenol hydroxylase-like FAD-dependent oxidoreductase
MHSEIKLSNKKARIAIVGGGIAGATAALCLGELGLDVTLIEKGPTLVNGPPICHLHAGGNLYREIPENECLTLLRESIDMLRLYPYAIDYRPTVIAVPTNDKGDPLDLIPRLEILQTEYQRLIDIDKRNKVLGPSEQYFKLFTREEAQALQKRDIVETPSSLSEWMIPVTHHVDLKQLKFPIIMVQEYGVNLFRLAASAELALQKMSNCTLLTNTSVQAIQSSSDNWLVEYQSNGQKYTEKFDFLINAAGFRSGLVDDMLGYGRRRLVEFKAAYVTEWPGCSTIWPELIFFGDRGTPEGMAQFTPYPNGYFQLHGMTESITLFDNGLVESAAHSAQPQLHEQFIDKIDKGWLAEEITSRTISAIEHLRRFIPEFSNVAKVSSKPLFGAQQIPGNDADLRAAGVSFVGNHYARCEIVKASSALNVADEIILQLQCLGYLDNLQSEKRNFIITETISEQDIEQYAQTICVDREYPISLANCNVRPRDL